MAISYKLRIWQPKLILLITYQHQGDLSLASMWLKPDAIQEQPVEVIMV